MAAVSGYQFGGALARALGLPAGTKFIQLTVGLDAAVEVTCRYYPDMGLLTETQALLQTYHLSLVEEVPATEDAQRAHHQMLEALHHVSRAEQDLHTVLRMGLAYPEVRAALRTISESLWFERLFSPATEE